jgi:hypothetical protein
MIYFDSMESIKLGMNNDEIKAKLYELFFNWRTSGSNPDDSNLPIDLEICLQDSGKDQEAKE